MIDHKYVFCEDCNQMTVATIDASGKLNLDESSDHFNHKIAYNKRISEDLLERSDLKSKLSLFMAVKSVKPNGLWSGLMRKAEDNPPRKQSRFSPK